MRRSIHALTACAVLLIWGCNAPRNNPYDPQSSNYLGPEANPGSISGRVSKLFSPSLGISGALIRSLPDSLGFTIAATSNSLGFYSISDISPGQYQLVCSLIGYLNDTLSVQVNSGTTSESNIHLDALPVIQSFQITSQYIFYGPTPPTLERAILARVTLTDADGFSDINHLNLFLNGFIDTTFVGLDSVIGALSYHSIRLPQTVFPGDTIGQVLVGDQFTCTAWDDAGGNANVSASIAHILPVIPEQNVTQTIFFGPPIVLSWQPYDFNFPFVYNVQITRILPLPQVIAWTQEGISSESLSVSPTLPDATYTWILQVEDDFGNMSQSAPSTQFEVDFP
jgi:hypothetical protein